MKPLPKPPKPAVMFPSIKKLAFKIPRERKKPESLAVRVGKLWQEAISVDPTGQLRISTLSCFHFLVSSRTMVWSKTSCCQKIFKVTASI